MTRPIYEPSLPRTDAELGYGRDQLFRRPAPVAAGSGGVWAYMVWYDGQDLPATDAFPFQWTPPPFWQEAWISDEASANNLLYPDQSVAGNFALFFANPIGALWVADVRAVFDDAGTPPVAGDFFGIGNLIQSGSTLGNLDVHGFTPADLLLTHAFDHTFNVVAARAVEDATTDRFVTAELGAFAGGVDMWMDQVEIHMWRPQTGDASIELSGS